MNIPWWRARTSSVPDSEAPHADHGGDLAIRAMSQADYGYLASVLDRWWGGPSGQRAEPLFFYELGDLALVAERDAEVVGFLFGFQTSVDSKLAYVHLVGIHPQHRRGGVGKQLYERFSARCRDQGAERLKAIAAVGDEAAVRFHLALGFAAEEVANYAGPGRARMVFTKSL